LRQRSPLRVADPRSGAVSSCAHSPPARCAPVGLAPGCRKTSNLDAYNDYLLKQIRELVTNDGPLITVWNDAPQMFAGRGDKTTQLVRALQPDITINDRTGDGGVYDPPEQRIGPMPTGEIEPRQVERLKEMVTWPKQNGESICDKRGVSSRCWPRGTNSRSEASATASGTSPFPPSAKSALNRNMNFPWRAIVNGFVWATLPTLASVPAIAEPTNQAGIKDLNTPRTLPAISSKTEWEARAQDIREQILVSCGLWPLPEKRPLHPVVFDPIERDGYSVAKVYFQTYPGFYLAGNLYRPLHRRGPFPGVLNPHGHWANGRLADTPEGSIAARCISFARQGMVAFSYDMVGYNDTQFADSAGLPFNQAHRQFGTNQTDQLWSISPMGLQTWNSIRALDFLASLPEVDRKRLACTGESGGGTQTFILGAIDDRLAVQSPVVMVSHTMQGGCVCENAPGLRVEYSNLEIAAAAAPRPQLLVAATGDWTKTTMEVEGPAVQNVYRLFGLPEHLRFVRFDFGHNYNQTSREAVYAWFGQWLLKHPEPELLKEQACHKESDADLRVFPDGKLPKGALTTEQFTESLKQAHQAAWQKLQPRNQTGLEHFKRTMLPAWKHTLQIEWPLSAVDVRQTRSQQTPDWQATEMTVSRSGDAQAMTALYFRPTAASKEQRTSLVILADSSGTDAHVGFHGEPVGLTAKLLRSGHAVMVILHFSASEPTDPFANFFTTYNRTRLQQRVRDLLAACSASRGFDHDTRKRRVVLCGLGNAGLWALLAAPAADAVLADCNTLNVANDIDLLGPDVFCPGLRNIGTFEGAAMLAAPHPLFLHTTGDRFTTQGVQLTYQVSGSRNQLHLESGRPSDEALVEWISKL
ncbi:MAG: acetylxylan esterase, partial [Verrucomicrobiota bacterium]